MAEQERKEELHNRVRELEKFVIPDLQKRVKRYTDLPNRVHSMEWEVAHLRESFDKHQDRNEELLKEIFGALKRTSKTMNFLRGMVFFGGAMVGLVAWVITLFREEIILAIRIALGAG